jgi:hypothetical protein
VTAITRLPIDLVMSGMPVCRDEIFVRTSRVHVGKSCTTIRVLPRDKDSWSSLTNYLDQLDQPG